MSSSPLATEKGTIRKKWTGLLPVALIYPNSYPLAVSNLGYQLVYSQLNDFAHIVCERFVYPAAHQTLRSLESNRPLSDFGVVLASISFEDDYPRLAAMLAAGGIEPFAADRGSVVGPGSPLVIFGGVAVFMNPEPLAPFADIMVIGEAEPVLPSLVGRIEDFLARGGTRRDFLLGAGRSLPGCYIPSLYSFQFDTEGRVLSTSHEQGLPDRVAKVTLKHTDTASHSQILSPEAELGMFMTELGRGCSMGCRFCAAGFIYRPPRRWDVTTILKGLQACPGEMDRIGLLGMEMAGQDVLDRVAEYLAENSCSLSFSSLRADRISEKLLSLLSRSGLRSVAIAPDGCSERLRRVINKGLTEEELLAAAEKLVHAGIVNLKLYVMVGLPTETEDDLAEMVRLVKRLRKRILPIGRKRGRVSEITLSVNSFVPKPWTPFQYVSFGGIDRETADRDRDENNAVMALKGKIRYLRQGLSGVANLRIKADRPERVLQQAVYARGDRRLGPVLMDIGLRGLSLGQALKKHGLTAWEYAVRHRDREERFCWDVIDHGIRKDYLWQEFCRSMKEKPTIPCDPTRCRSCGVCNEQVSV
ncbi:MAG: radical SAM protein [Desulfobulbaceae bacterium]|nr:radical SAM protein [Desulfobulbaceae bacterium]